jgi:ABC-2 type transport system ATP-binding protein
MTDPNQVLEVDAVEKRFQTVKAVDRLSFHVRRGEIFALLGPNGAGKTTMVRMLIGMFLPDSGRIHFTLENNHSTMPDPTRTGYLPEDRGLYQEIPVLRTLTYFGTLRGLSRPEAKRSARAWLNRLGLEDRAQEKLGALSKGNQQKVQFISSILHKPSFVILDEPFAGLDPINQDQFLTFLRELRDQGTTILLCAHQMHLVERLADRLLLIDRGREVLHGSLSEILPSGAGNKITLNVSGSPDSATLENNPAIESFRWNALDRELMLVAKEDVRLRDLLITLGAELDILSVHSEKLSLHDIFVQAVAANVREPSEQIQ